VESIQLSPNDIGVIASFIVPGYFAIFGYALVHTKANKAFSKLLIESVALSLPLVGLYNAIWGHLVHHPIYSTSVKYFVPLLLLSLGVGYVFARVRDTDPLKRATKLLRLRGPSDDFIEVQFKKLKKSEVITVTLKNDEVFSGIRKGLSAYRKGEPQRCYFNYVAWYDKTTQTWNDRTGSLIISLDDVRYIETTNMLPDS
jgi:hypothetical protein